MPYIETIPYEAAESPLRDIYDELIKSRGKLAAVHQIQSLNPPTIMAHMDLYLKIMFGKSPLKRYQREMIAVVVSKMNRCEYCIRHHAEALNFYWKDNERIEALIKNHQTAELESADHALCQFAENLTLYPGSGDREKWIQVLRGEELSDRAILDGTLVIGYFNFVNRIVQGLGVEIENEGVGGYNY